MALGFQSGAFQSPGFQGGGGAGAGSARGRRYRYRNPRHYTIGDKHYVVYDDDGLRALLAELIQKDDVPVAKEVKVKAAPVRVYEPDGSQIVVWDELKLPNVNMATVDALIAQSVKFGQDEIVNAIEQMIRKRREEEEELLMLAAFLH